MERDLSSILKQIVEPKQKTMKTGKEDQDSAATKIILVVSMISC
jgi:hypothetical protein